MKSSNDVTILLNGLLKLRVKLMIAMMVLVLKLLRQAHINVLALMAVS